LFADLDAGMPYVSFCALVPPLAHTHFCRNPRLYAVSNNMILGQYYTPINVTNAGPWASVQATRAFSLLSVLIGGGAVIFAAVSFFVTLSLKQELWITTMSFIACEARAFSACSIRILTLFAMTSWLWLPVHVHLGGLRQHGHD
jgi:hypothetical protein